MSILHLMIDRSSHSILRFVAVINAARDNFDDSLLALRHLDALDPMFRPLLWKP